MRLPGRLGRLGRPLYMMCEKMFFRNISLDGQKPPGPSSSPPCGAMSASPVLADFAGSRGPVSPWCGSRRRPMNHAAPRCSCGHFSPPKSRARAHAMLPRRNRGPARMRTSPRAARSMLRRCVSGGQPAQSRTSMVEPSARAARAYAGVSPPPRGQPQDEPLGLPRGPGFGWAHVGRSKLVYFFRHTPRRKKQKAGVSSRQTA